MPFGLSTAPATFLRLMSRVFRTYILDILIVYLDDIIVYSPDFQSHLQRLDTVFSRLAQHKLKLKAEKCHLFKERVKFLGHIISAKAEEKDSEKVVAVAEWTRPQTVKELRSFLGFSSYYRRFVPHFTQIAAPLHKLVSEVTGPVRKEKHKKQKVPLNSSWTEIHEKAFEELKVKLTNSRISRF